MSTEGKQAERRILTAEEAWEEACSDSGQMLIHDLPPMPVRELGDPNLDDRGIVSVGVGDEYISARWSVERQRWEGVQPQEPEPAARLTAQGAFDLKAPKVIHNIPPTEGCPVKDDRLNYRNLGADDVVLVTVYAYARWNVESQRWEAVDRDEAFTQCLRQRWKRQKGDSDESNMPGRGAISRVSTTPSIPCVVESVDGDGVATVRVLGGTLMRCRWNDDWNGFDNESDWLGLDDDYEDDDEMGDC